MEGPSVKICSFTDNFYLYVFSEDCNWFKLLSTLVVTGCQCSALPSVGPRQFWRDQRQETLFARFDCFRSFCKCSVFSLSTAKQARKPASCRAHGGWFFFMTWLHFDVTGMFLLGFWDWSTLHHSKSRTFPKGKNTRHNTYTGPLIDKFSTWLLQYFRMIMLQSELPEGKTQQCWRT